MAATTSSILDDFLIDTTRLSLIRRYRPPFELDKPVLSEPKKQAMLELMKQQKEADKEFGPAPDGPEDKMDVDLAAPTAADSADNSKMDVDESETTRKLEQEREEREKREAALAAYEIEKREKLIRLAELDKKVKEAEAKIESIEEAKGILFVKLKQVLAVESKSRQEEQRLIQQRAEEARQALLLQQQQQLPFPPPGSNLPLDPFTMAGLPPPPPPFMQGQQGFPPPQIPQALAPPHSRSPERSFASPSRGGFDRDYRRDDDNRSDRNYQDRFGGDRDRDNRGRDRFDDSRENRFGGGYRGGAGGQFNDRDRQRDIRPDYGSGGGGGSRRDYRDGDNSNRGGGDRNDRDSRDRDWNRRYEKDGYVSRPMGSSPPPQNYNRGGDSYYNGGGGYNPSQSSY